MWLRSRKPWACLRIRDTAIRSIRNFFHERGFVNIDSPIFTPAACEGTSTLFEVNYFDDKAYLTQSGQLYAEAAAMAFGKVFSFGPTFRAEKSKTRRHLTEFWMVEPEVAFATLDDVMELAESMIARVVRDVLEERKEELKALERDVTKLERVTAPFPRISYDEAVALLRAKNLPFEYGNDLGAPDETAIGEHFDRPIMIHRYPHQVKAFYMKRDPNDARFALCVDVIAPEGYGEIVGEPTRRRREGPRRANRGAQAPRGRIWLVFGPTPIRRRAPLGIRHGARAVRRVDLRRRSPAGGHPVPANAEQDLSVTE